MIIWKQVALSPADAAQWPQLRPDHDNTNWFGGSDVAVANVHSVQLIALSNLIRAGVD